MSSTVGSGRGRLPQTLLQDRCSNYRFRGGRSGARTGVGVGRVFLRHPIESLSKGKPSSNRRATPVRRARRRVEDSDARYDDTDDRARRGRSRLPRASARSPSPFLDGLFLAEGAHVTFHKLQWELAGSLTLVRRPHLGLSRRLRLGPVRARRCAAHAHRSRSLSHSSLRSRSSISPASTSLDTSQALAQSAKGMVKFVLHFGFLVTGVALLDGARSRSTG